MANIKYIWNSAKEASNRIRHGISFHTASKALADPFRFDEIQDDLDTEIRWRTLAMADSELILFIVHTARDNDEAEVVRIISARRATRQEKLKYEQNRFQNYH